MATKAARDQAIRAAGARRIKAGRDSALARLRDSSAKANEVLQDVPEALEMASVYDVLTRCATMGRTKAERVLKCAGVWPFTRMDRLTTHEREALLRELPESGEHE